MHPLQLVDRESSIAPAGSEPRRMGSACTVCGNEDFRRLFQKGGRDFWKCRNCGMERLDPPPTALELQLYYDQSYRDGMYQHFAAACEMKRRTAELRWQMIHPHVPAGRWLDVGCSDGTFLEQLGRQGINATGIDISEVAVAKAVARGVRAYCQLTTAHFPEQPYDVVSAFDVLEHVLDPSDFLADIRRLLRPGGTVVITTPNLQSLSHALMGRRWYFYIPEEHMNYFAPRNLRRLLARNGFEPTYCKSIGKPLTFDYSLSQLQQYNPLIYRALHTLGAVVPQQWRNVSVQLHIGEMLAVARRR